MLYCIKQDDPSILSRLHQAHQRVYVQGTALHQHAHKHARGVHPSYPSRCEVPDTIVPWTTEARSYAPPAFTHHVVIQNDSTRTPNGWADPKRYAQIDFAARISYVYRELGIVCSASGCPLNPAGRTGLCGRGLLGKWGPNHAADPIVTRRHPDHIHKPNTIQMVAIQRGDTGHWAIPGGMVDAGESVSVTLRREFEEEAAKHNMDATVLDALFDPSNATEIYRGYVDDPRNTDNAWMETCAVHFHCDATVGSQLALEAGDDAVQVRWLDVDDGCEAFRGLYANHREMVLKAVEAMGCSR